MSPTRHGHRLLIDTVSPASFGPAGGFDFGGRSFGAAPRFPGFPFEELERFVGTRLDVLVGLDALASATWELDFESKDLVVDPSAEPSAVLFTMSGRNPLPTLVRINGAPCAALVDRGAKHSYVLARLVAGQPTGGTVRDYSHIAGWSETGTVSADLSWRNANHICTFGRLDQGLIAQAVALTGSAATLGTDILRSVGRVRFARRQ